MCVCGMGAQVCAGCYFKCVTSVANSVLAKGDMIRLKHVSTSS